jgi:hypothetical protein
LSTTLTLDEPSSFRCWISGPDTYFTTAFEIDTLLYRQVACTPLIVRPCTFLTSPNLIPRHSTYLFSQSTGLCINEGRPNIQLHTMANSILTSIFTTSHSWSIETLFHTNYMHYFFQFITFLFASVCAVSELPRPYAITFNTALRPAEWDGYLPTTA